MTTPTIVQQLKVISKSVASDGVELVSGINDAVVDNSDPKNPIVNVEIPVKSISGTGGVTVNSIGDDYTIGYVPLAPFPVTRVNTSQTLSATVTEYIVSTTTATPITLTLPEASAFPVGEQYYPIRMFNASNQDVTVKIQNDLDFFNAPKNIVLKANRTGNSTLNLNAANFAATGGFPAFTGWEKDQSPIETKFTARFSGSVDMSNFYGAGDDIAYTEETTTDNPTVFELNSSNETIINITHRGSISGSTTATVDAQGFGPTYNVDMVPRIFRNGAFIDVEIGASRSGNFSGEDTHITQPFTCDVEAGDELRVLLKATNGLNANLIAATIQFSMVI